MLVHDRNSQRLLPISSFGSCADQPVLRLDVLEDHPNPGWVNLSDIGYDIRQTSRGGCLLR